MSVTLKVTKLFYPWEFKLLRAKPLQIRDRASCALETIRPKKGSEYVSKGWRVVSILIEAKLSAKHLFSAGYL